ncbi:MAG TPA: restriction endonuclease subunit R, partial [Erysipelotrichaceae bacterium]|nr:restriction endonuclease subunit R [Erysipelotrichaceae bacterium]
FDVKGATGIRKVTRTVSEGFNLYDNSGDMEEYKNNFVVRRIDGRDDSVEFINGIKIYAGDVIGKVSEDQLRRIQIRETILSHIQRERELFYKGIKVLSLFFIDEVAKYKQYDAAGNPMNGIYADMFEEEYNDIINHLQLEFGEDDYLKYLESIPAEKTHAGYFSIDKKGKMIDSKANEKRENSKEKMSNDVDAYDLIMKNKELLLDRNPKKSPVRFIFSHSALREGWDNPNVFQICTLKQSSSEVRKRQEVGRGLRLCVNQDGERMDVNVLGNDVHNVNVLTVIASESYDSFAKGLQSEIAEAVADRPRAVTPELFIGKVIKDDKGNEQVIDNDIGNAIYLELYANKYIDRKGVLTDKYYEDKANGELKVAEEVADSVSSVIEIIDSIYDSRAMQPENARSNNVELKVDEEKLAMPEFKALWNKINSKSVYVVDFDTDELIRKSINSLDRKLRVPKIYFRVETGAMEQIKSKEDLLSGTSFIKEESSNYGNVVQTSSNVKYDLIGKLVEETGLTRKAIIRILQGIQPETFNQFKDNPEEFIIKAAALINDEKATAIIEHITYDVMDEKYGTEVFTDPTIKGRLGVNAMKANKHLYDHVVYDSTNEMAFASELDTNKDVAVYVKLPKGFYISTPVGHYNPDWAIAFYEGRVKHIYFVAETKGSMNSMQLRLIEESKIHCAREHFKAISNGNVVYDVVDSYQTLLEKVMR